MHYNFRFQAFLLSVGMVLAAGSLAQLSSVSTLIPATCAAGPDCKTIDCSGNVDSGADSYPVYAACCQECNGKFVSMKDLCILEPLPGGPSSFAPTTKPFAIFWSYINGGLWQLIIGIGVGSAVFTGVMGGMEIVFGNGDSGAIDKAKTKIIWSIVGLIILLMSGVIMSFLNPVAFQNI